MKFLIKIILIFIIFIIYNTNLFSRQIYVNENTGDDKISINNNSPANPFKTISMAILASSAKDEIIIEGFDSSKKQQIIYRESLKIDSTKYRLKLTGKNNPLLDGGQAASKDSELKPGKNAIVVDARGVSIDGISMKNYQLNKKDKLPKEPLGVAIYVKTGISYVVIKNCNIENCNYGIILDGAIMCDISNNKISNITVIEGKKDSNGGIGIAVFPSGLGIEGNLIGTKGANIITKSAKYGICIGSPATEKNADGTKILNNTIQECEKGLGILNVTGIGEVSKNNFTGNNLALYIMGFPIDIWISENIFGGSKGASEIEANEKCDGFYLYDLWQRANNKFEKPTFAAVEGDDKIPLVKNVMYIRTQEAKAREDAGSAYKVKTK